MRPRPSRWRRLLVLSLVSLVTLLTLAWPSLANRGGDGSGDPALLPAAARPPQAVRGAEPRPLPTSLPCSGTLPCPPAGSAQDQKPLQVGAYVTALDGFNMLDNHINVEFYLWTRWRGDQASNPSDRLSVLNAPTDHNLDRFEWLDSRREDGSEWRLYKVRASLGIAWRLQNYPFDRHDVLIRLGSANPLAPGMVIHADDAQSGIDPELILYDWRIGRLSIEESAWSLQTNFGTSISAGQPGATVTIVPTLQLSIPLARRSGLALLSSFLGDFLAIGLCMLSLIIPYSRDDLILGAVFAAAGNSIFLAQILPVSALSGFAGNMQLIIYVGILYVVIADELLDRVFRGRAERLLRYVRPLLLPSYVLGTLLATYWVIPSDVLV